jgi:formylglycine-generating enzyme required for sulfatase activity
MKRRLQKGNLQIKRSSFSICGFLKNATYLLVCFFASSVYANNVTISNVSIQANSVIDGTAFTQAYKFVQFDIAWENSWRISTGPSNWDACWVFIKYKKTPETIWRHATLSAVEAQHVPAPNGTIKPTSDGKGVFIYRSSNMAQGSVSYPQTNVRWNIAADGLLETDGVEICVYAIEMVYVPEGSFFVGDGQTSGSIQAHLRRGDANSPFQISSEAEIILGGTDATNLTNNNNNSATGDGLLANLDDFDHTTTQTLPASFPKGFNAFYCMKYEATQFQYVEFLNKLTRTQQNSRTLTSITDAATSVTNRFVMSNSSTVNSAHRNGIRCDGTIPANAPILFYCDLNGNGTGNEADDGFDVAANQVMWTDEAAYLDWAGLRPMTELEYEKACRGNQTPVMGEYAWGTNSYIHPQNRTNSGASDETTSTSGTNAHMPGTNRPDGPFRVGCFGQGGTTRVETGSSYYGIMELSGSLFTRVVVVGREAARSYDGLHGDGNLNASGNADVLNWPTTNAVGTTRRGGSYAATAARARVSSRFSPAEAHTTRLNQNGIRGVRTAP